MDAEAKNFEGLRSKKIIIRKGSKPGSGLAGKG
jgi:hypothetical protein